MLARLGKSARTPAALIALIALQAVCAIFFIADVAADYIEVGVTGAHDIHFYIELVASLSLIAAIMFEVGYLMHLLEQRARLQNSLVAANAAVNDVIEMHYELWGLTPTEQDVAMFLIKGLNIAGLRGTAEGTIKAHLNAIYRKSGTRNKTEVLSLLIDAMMCGDAGAVAASAM